MLSYWWVDKYAEIIIKILNWAFGTLNCIEQREQAGTDLGQNQLLARVEVRIIKNNCSSGNNCGRMTK